MDTDGTDNRPLNGTEKASLTGGPFLWEVGIVGTVEIKMQLSCKYETNIDNLLSSQENSSKRNGSAMKSDSGKAWICEKVSRGTTSWDQGFSPRRNDIVRDRLPHCEPRRGSSWSANFSFFVSREGAGSIHGSETFCLLNDEGS